MNRLSREKRCQIVASLVEGNSIRATCRMTDTAKGTVIKLLRDLGTVCAEYQDEFLRDLSCNVLECDEIWSFCYAKQKNLRDEYKRTFGYGDVWTFTAICADSKLVPTWRIGSRDVGTATDFMQDLASRLANRAQITTDGHSIYLNAVEDAFGAGVDYAMLQKINGSDPEPQKRYSPAKCIGIDVETIQGNPDPDRISTSYVERQNLTMRMSMRRFTRLTKRLLQKGRESGARRSPAFHVLQLLPHPPEPPHNPGHGDGRYRPPVENRGHCGPPGRAGAELKEKLVRASDAT